LPQIKSGKLKALAVGGAKRSPTLPDVPALAEAGVPGYEAVNWWGNLSPAETPKPILDRLYKECTAIQKSADINKRFVVEAVDPVQMTQAEFAKYIETEAYKWSRVIKEAAITPQ
jgi:tripartite-type tricarboxylate transporter receptor subunit TctC